MQQEYYKAYYELERKHWWFQVRGEIIMQHIESLVKDKKDLKILNIGVATGYTSVLLSRFGTVKSVEFDKECYEFTKKEVEIDIVNGSITDLPFENESYDLVCAFDVIEHIDDDKLAVSEMRRVCKTGGNLCVTVPAFMLLWSEHDIINQHYRRYRKHEMVSLFEQNSSIYATYFNSFLFLPIAFFRVLKTAISGKPKLEEAQSDFIVLRQNIFTWGAKMIFSLEKPLLKMGLKFPFGVSVLLSAKK
jgi:SAM-dependent methyltransferase